MKFLKYIILIIFLSSSSSAQIYLGLIEKEGIFLNENLNLSKFSYEYIQEQLNRLSYNSFPSPQSLPQGTLRKQNIPPLLLPSCHSQVINKNLSISRQFV
jgi:hypothetical protein